MKDQSKTDLTLQLLLEIEQKEIHSQRSFAIRLGIALGLINTFVKRCVRKGWVKMSKAPARRYAYYLTPKGFAEKSRLTADYLDRSFHFFRQARSQCLEILLHCERTEQSRVLLYGAGDLAEIATLAARETGVEIAGVVTIPPHMPGTPGVGILDDFKQAGQFDSVMVTDVNQPQKAFDDLKAVMPTERIHTPPLLMVNRRTEIAADQSA